MGKALLYGFFTGLGLIGYFLLMILLGEAANIYLRILNIFIIAAGIYFLFNALIAGRDGHFGYIQGLGSGAALSATAIVTFITFLTLYIRFINPAFMDVIESSQIWGNDLSLAEATFGIGLEGVVSGAVISFIWMQWFKREVNNEDEV